MSRARGWTRRATGWLPLANVALALALALAVAVAACTGAGDDAGSVDGDTSDEPSPTATSAPTTTPDVGSTSEQTAAATVAPPPTIAPTDLVIDSFAVPDGSRPHDVAPAADGGVWYTAQSLGELGWLDPATGETRHVDLGDGSRPHGVIVDDRGFAWVTDGGLNAIIAVDPGSGELTTYPLPADRPDANLNTATFDGNGILWFTGQNGIYGSLDPSTGDMTVHDAPRGRGPYGIATTSDGDVYLASLAGSYIGAVDTNGSGELTVLEPPTPDQGARRVWSDSQGSIWVSEWNSGNLSRYDPASGEWDTWPLPGDGGGSASTYAVYVDENDIVWTSDFTANALVRFDPATEQFTQLTLPHDPGDVRQILGRSGEVWGAESAADHLVVIRTDAE